MKIIIRNLNKNTTNVVLNLLQIIKNTKHY